MAFDRFLIAPINTGLETDLRPWLIPDDAFQVLENAYVFRGRVRKRFGSRYTGFGAPSAATAPLYSRLSINIGSTDGSGNISGTVPGNVFKVGQLFSIGTELFTVVVTGTPGVMKTTGSSTVHTYNTNTGAYVINGAAALQAVYFYPAEPVMGLTIFKQGAFNDQPAFAFDTQMAYTFTTGQWLQPWGGTNPIWHGDNTDFFWATTWIGQFDDQSVLFVTNFHANVGSGSATDDSLWSYNYPIANQWSQFYPYFNPNGGAPQTGPYVLTARIIVVFHNRLLLLNTIENSNNNVDHTLTTNTQYGNRVRYSFWGSPFDTNAWYQPNAQDSSGNVSKGAGFLDASTKEEIVSAQFIKDRLIVFFDHSTWELVYTGNDLNPFSWQKINTELGSEALLSSVPFDQQILTMGSTGIHACNGANVGRIDFKIPNLIFQITQKNLGCERVSGIRDYFVEQVYWTYPSIQKDPREAYPNKVLVYNYVTNSWAINDDCITVFGYFNQQQQVTWASLNNITWEQWDTPWASGSQQDNFRDVIAGNQQGFVFIVDAGISSNAAVMQITNMVISGSGINFTIKDHTLTPDDYFQVNYAQGVTGVNGTTYQVSFIIDADTIFVTSATFTGTYTGGGVVQRVSNINILSKQWNPYVSKGRNVYVARIDFCVRQTDVGQVTIDYFPSGVDDFSMIEQGGPTGTNMLMGTNVLETYPYPTVPLELQQERLWHPIYFQTDGTCIQIRIFMSDDQMRSPTIPFENFELEGLVLHTMPASYRLQ